MITLKQAHATWLELYRDIGADMDDAPMQSESWCDYTDHLCRDGDITDAQYHYAPAFDDDMPDSEDLADEAMWLVEEETDEVVDLESMSYIEAVNLMEALSPMTHESVLELLA